MKNIFDKLNQGKLPAVSTLKKSTWMLLTYELNKMIRIIVLICARIIRQTNGFDVFSQLNLFRLNDGNIIVGRAPVVIGMIEHLGPMPFNLLP